MGERGGWDQYCKPFLPLSFTRQKSRTTHVWFVSVVQIYVPTFVQTHLSSSLKHQNSATTWSSLVEGVEQLDQSNSKTCMESYHVSTANFVGFCHKHNNLPLGPIPQPSSPSAKELHGHNLRFRSPDQQKSFIAFISGGWAGACVKETQLKGGEGSQRAGFVVQWRQSVQQCDQKKIAKCL